MNSTEKALADHLAPSLAESGFRWVAVRRIFVRKESFGLSSFSWASYPTSEDGGRLELVPLLGVRHDVVENVVNELGLIHGDGNKKYTMTVDRGLGFFPFRNGADEKHYIRFSSVDNDVWRAASGIVSMLGGYGREFYDKYSSLLECSRGLNYPIETKVHALCNSFPSRAYHGVAAAFFSESSRVPELMNKYICFARAADARQSEQISERLDRLIAIATSMT